MYSNSSTAIGATTGSCNSSNGWNRDRTTIYAGDLRSPWKSVYGFPMAAARLAAGEELVLHCREDEVFDYLTRLNELLESPEHLNRVYRLLEELFEATQKKFDQRLQQQEQPFSDSEIPDLVAEVEEILTSRVEQTVAERLAFLLSPHDPTREIVGLGKMLARLRRVMAELNIVKDGGFKIAIIHRRRQPQRPGLNCPHNESVPAEEQSGDIPADFLIPGQYHLTLWAYVLAKSEGEAFVAWN
jgi:hypothetical protein